MQQENQADGLSELEQNSKERSECFGFLRDTYRNTNIIFAFLYNSASVSTLMVYRPQVRACQNTGTVCGTPVLWRYKMQTKCRLGVAVVCFALSCFLNCIKRYLSWWYIFNELILLHQKSGSQTPPQ